MQRPWRSAASWLAPAGLLSLLTYRTQDHLPRDGTIHNRLYPLPSITNLEKYLTAGPYRGIFSTEGPSFQETLASVVDIKLASTLGQ